MAWSKVAEREEREKKEVQLKRKGGKKVNSRDGAEEDKKKSIDKERKREREIKL